MKNNRIDITKLTHCSIDNAQSIVNQAIGAPALSALFGARLH